MWVRFWGTRGSIAKAGPSTVRYGGNTSCVEVRSDDGTVVVLDCGTGAHGLGMALLKEGVAGRGHVLVSHTHWDHIQGLPFFAPFFVPGNEWDLYGPRSLGSTLKQTLAGQMEYTYFPITHDRFGATLRYHDLVEGTFQVGGVRVTTWYLNHPALTLGYRLEADGVSVVYATDHEPHHRRLADGGVPPKGSQDERHGQFLADADLVIHDTQYTAAEYPDRMGWGHSTMEYVVDLAAHAAVRKLAMFHHDPLRDDDSLEALVGQAQVRAGNRKSSVGILAAAEGARIEVPRGARSHRVVGGGHLATEDPLDALGRLSVLVVAGEGVAADTLRAAAKADGLALHTARDTETGLWTFERSAPTVVVVEEGDAIDAGALSRAVRSSSNPDTPLVRVGEGSDPAVTDWLPLPFSAEYARTRLRAWALRAAPGWEAPPVAEDEEGRLAALHALGQLGAPPEERFDRHVRIAAELFGVEAAAINLVGRDHQSTRACTVGSIPDHPRDTSMCAWAILGDGVLQVADVTADARFRGFPQNPSSPLRFYAGAPLRLANGHAVGSLCLIDPHPRTLSDTQIGLLEDLAALVVEELQATAG